MFETEAKSPPFFTLPSYASVVESKYNV